MAKEQGPIGTVVGQKISSKSLGFTKEVLKAIVERNGFAEAFLYRVIGRAVNAQKYVTSFEDQDPQEGFGLVGSWKITKNDGEVIEAEATVYISGPMHQHAVAAVLAGNIVDLAIDVFVIQKEDNPKYDENIGYMFVNRSLIEPDRSAIIELEKQLGNTAIPGAPK